MNTWQIIRETLCKGCTPGTIRHIQALKRASDIFVALIDQNKLRDAHASQADFNADRELSEALVQRGAVETILKG